MEPIKIEVVLDIEAFKAELNKFILELSDVNTKLGSILALLPKPVPTPEPVLPVPTPTPTPTPVLTPLLFSANMETGNANEWSGNYLMGSGNVLTNIVSAKKPQSGTHSIETVCNMGLNQMASTQYFEHNGVTNNNRDAIYSAWFWANESFDLAGNSPSFDNIMQWKAKMSHGLSHPVFYLGFNVRGGKGTKGSNYLELRHAMEHFVGNSYNVPEIVQVNVPIQKWFELKVRYIQATTNTGRVMVELDNVLIYDVNNVLTRPPRDKAGNTITDMMWACCNYGMGHIPASRTLFIDSSSIRLPN